MLFRRRISQPLVDKIRNMVWPRMGWRRVASYYKHRTVRIPASENSIATGLAIGCAISWTPTFGTHLLQCAFLSWLLRGNWLASFLGTAFGNPWTFPVLMLCSYQVGKIVLLSLGFDTMVYNHPGPLTVELFKEQGWSLFLPTLVGGYILALATFPLFYFPFYYMIKGARAARMARIKKTLHKDIQIVTGQKL